MDRVNNEKDLGVLFDDKLTFQSDIQARVSKASSVMGIIRRTYTYIDQNSFKLVYTSLVRPHVEYGAPIWNPVLKRDIEDLERVQRRATKQVPSLRNLSYEDRL